MQRRRQMQKPAASGSEVDGPELRGRAQEFEAYQRFTGLRFQYAHYAAGEFFVGLNVGH